MQVLSSSQASLQECHAVKPGDWIMGSGEREKSPNLIHKGLKGDKGSASSAGRGAAAAAWHKRCQAWACG